MTQNTAIPQKESASFAETALRLGGKSDEEARRMGAVDKADEQVETLFAAQYQTANSPIHKAIWEGKVALELFAPAPPTGPHRCDQAMEKSLQVVRRRRELGTLFDAQKKVSDETI